MPIVVSDNKYICKICFGMGSFFERDTDTYGHKEIQCIYCNNKERLSSICKVKIVKLIHITNKHDKALCGIAEVFTGWVDDMRRIDRADCKECLEELIRICEDRIGELPSQTDFSNGTKIEYNHIAIVK